MEVKGNGMSKYLVHSSSFRPLNSGINSAWVKDGKVGYYHQVFLKRGETKNGSGTWSVRYVHVEKNKISRLMMFTGITV